MVDVVEPGVDIVVGFSVVDVVGASVVNVDVHVDVVGGVSQPHTQNTLVGALRAVVVDRQLPGETANGLPVNP